MTMERIDGWRFAVRVVPGAAVTTVRVTGEVDGEAATRLAAVAAQLTTSLSERIVVDLAEVSFAGAALPNFLARLRSADGRRPVEVCHASAMAALVLRLTRMGDLLTSDCAH